MRMESLIQRKNGTVVTLGDKTYHFKPSPGDKRHTCEVDDDDHVAILASIREGYRIARGNKADDKPKEDDEPKLVTVTPLPVQHPKLVTGTTLPVHPQNKPKPPKPALVKE